MKEKEIIKGEKINIKKVTRLIIIVGIVLFVLIWISQTSSGFYHDRLDDIGYVLFSMIPYFASITLLPFLIIAFVFNYLAKKEEIIVTDKRVYGIAAFGNRVDLPFDKISAVATTFFKGISISTSSGSIKFYVFKNNFELHSAISELLVKRQDTSSKNKKTEQPHDAIDELKRYKELLDSGTITQEEYDKKKKQLLDL